MKVHHLEIRPKMKRLKIEDKMQVTHHSTITEQAQITLESQYRLKQLKTLFRNKIKIFKSHKEHYIEEETAIKNLR